MQAQLWKIESGSLLYYSDIKLLQSFVSVIFIATALSLKHMPCILSQTFCQLESLVQGQAEFRLNDVGRAHLLHNGTLLLSVCEVKAAVVLQGCRGVHLEGVCGAS